MNDNNALNFFNNLFNKNNKERDTVRTLYIVMQKVGGYEQLMNLPISSLKEIIKCIEWESKEQNKVMRK